LTSFASPGGSDALDRSTDVKPFGASGDRSDEENEDEDEHAVAGFEKEKEDERFFEQQSMLPFLLTKTCLISL
jgi:Ran-binding protein 3